VLSDCIRGLPDNTVHLEKSYRFDENIARFAGAMNDGRVDLVESLLTDDQPTNLYFDRGDLVKEAAEKYLDYMHSALAVTDEEGLEDLFQQLNRFRILCATRRGPNGVEMMNSGVERYLERSGYDCSLPWYVGRPLIVRENSYSLGLFNGDIGICLADKEDEFKRKIWFESEKGGFRALSPSRLPSHETVFGMTIHKSQGSEFDNLLICLPDEPSPVLCRELLYTGVTRARKQVAVRAKKEILTHALEHRVVRCSGLFDMIRDLPD
ncbi:MAG: ATP-binding domain-containing protein, partial [Thermodesulfobacteriota bacterium]